MQVQHSRNHIFGYTISADGIQTIDENITAIKNAWKPSNASEVGSFLGLVNYCSHFIPNFFTIAARLTTLTQVRTIHIDHQQIALEFLQKENTCQQSVTVHFDPTAPTQVPVNASPMYCTYSYSLSVI